MALVIGLDLFNLSFTSNDVPYLFIIHEYGHNSITNKVEDVVSTIENQFLQDIGFGIIEDSVQIFYKDIYDDYNQVELEAGIKSRNGDLLMQRNKPGLIRHGIG